jgi:hypothetical protein
MRFSNEVPRLRGENKANEIRSNPNTPGEDCDPLRAFLGYMPDRTFGFAGELRKVEGYDSSSRHEESVNEWSTEGAEGQGEEGQSENGN